MRHFALRMLSGRQHQNGPGASQQVQLSCIRLHLAPAALVYTFTIFNIVKVYTNAADARCRQISEGVH